MSKCSNKATLCIVGTFLLAGVAMEVVGNVSNLESGIKNLLVAWGIVAIVVGMATAAVVHSNNKNQTRVADEISAMAEVATGVVRHSAAGVVAVGILAPRAIRAGVPTEVILDPRDDLVVR